MKRLLTLIIAAIALQSCSMTHTGSNYYPYGYDVPVSPTHISINIDKQPAWGPYGYDCAAFYYMPEINIYYDTCRPRIAYMTFSAPIKWSSITPRRGNTTIATAHNIAATAMTVRRLRSV